jgi:inosine triphosphate pyrophosphatase
MKDFVFITGNQHKADYLAKWLGMPVEHKKVDLEELQSLDLKEVVEHKARTAYATVQKPVLVEDVALIFAALGRLPGTMIKWFLEEIGNDGLCKIMQGYDDRQATASIMYAYYDGAEMRTFEGHVDGRVARQPRSSDEATAWKSSLSWNSVFIPNGSEKTYGQMSDEELVPFSHRRQAVNKLREFLESL